MQQRGIQIEAKPFMVTRDALNTIAGVHGLAAMVRDEELRVRWCDDAFASFCDIPREKLLGTTLRDILPEPAAREREAVIREVINTGEPATFLQFGCDKRLVCRILPLDSESFGYRGVLCIVREGDLADIEEPTSKPRRVLRTAYLDDLALLTKSELRPLYDLALGASNNDIAERQFRSVRTIENHVESIHRKLGTSTRSALVRFATERGVHGFTPQEWDLIVEGASETRRAPGPAIPPCHTHRGPPPAVN